MSIEVNELGIILIRSKYDFKTRRAPSKGSIYTGTINDLPEKFQYLLPKDLDGYKFCRIYEK
jgi:hypothetical protein